MGRTSPADLRTPDPSRMCRVHGRAGRIRLTLEGSALGPDCWICLTGGLAHLGAVAFAGADGGATLVQAPGHREGELALAIARLAATRLQCRAAVLSGIHYDHIEPAEIAAVEALAPALARAFCQLLSGGRVP